jgi:hypothetical protein
MINYGADKRISCLVVEKYSEKQAFDFHGVSKKSK